MASTIRAHTEAAPEESSWLDDVGGFFGDLGEGAWDSFSGFAGALWDVIPFRPSGIRKATPMAWSPSLRALRTTSRIRSTF